MPHAPYGWPYRTPGAGPRPVETIYLPGDRPVNPPPPGWRGDSHYACHTRQCVHGLGDRGCMTMFWTDLDDRRV